MTNYTSSSDIERMRHEPIKPSPEQSKSRRQYRDNKAKIDKLIAELGHEGFKKLLSTVR